MFRHSRHSQDLFGGEAQNFSRRAFFDVHSDHPFMDLIEESALVPETVKPSVRFSQTSNYCTRNMGSFSYMMASTPPPPPPFFSEISMKPSSSYHLFLSIMNAPCEDIPDVTTATGCRGEYGASFLPIQPGAAILYPSNSRSWRPYGMYCQIG